MKNIIVIIIAAIALSCKAQSFIKPLGTGSCPSNDPSCYEKDVNNEFEKFVGTWKYENGNTSLTFKLKKEILYRTSPNTNYQDLLVGEYQYIENGTEKVNTLDDLNNVLISGYQHKISGSVFTRHLPNFCIDNSTPQEIKIEVRIEDPDDEFTEGRLILRHINDNGTEKLQVCIYDYTTMSAEENARLPIPNGYYVFVKQD